MIMDASYLCWRLMRTGALLLVAGSPTLSAQTPPLTLVSTAWSPFTNEPGRPRFALDLLRSMITDGTYHRLLHLDWIQADVNNDGIAELVPRSDRAGASPPAHPYVLFSMPQQTPTSEAGKPGFFHRRHDLRRLGDRALPVQSRLFDRPGLTPLDGQRVQIQVVSTHRTGAARVAGVPHDRER